MDVHTSISLKDHTTMRLGGMAALMVDAVSIEEVKAVYDRARQQGLSVFVLGSGSNVIAHDEGYAGIVLRNRIKGLTVLADDGQVAELQVGAGELWDDVVARAVELGLSGIEAMSGIPGTAGAAPVQNIGAYGQELSDSFVSLEAYDTQADQVVTLSAEQCGFSYRHSIFRGEAAGRYCIISIRLRLYHKHLQPPFYAALQSYLEVHQITDTAPWVIRDAVLAIRAEKLPDPAQRPNAGSFFKNAVIELWQLRDLRTKYPEMPCYDMPDGVCKVPTGWLIEKAGLKGQLLHGMRVHDKNALVLINESAQSYADLAAARDEIIQTVYDTFQIMIEQEPLELQ